MSNSIKVGVLRLPQLIEKVGLSRSSIYAMAKTGEFPPPIRLGRRAVGWRTDEVESWISGRTCASAERRP
ncbi:MAG: AlpA family phage regulatory protein [Gallionella sp.]|nr:AlpA family phage regulatory protein [Gallionella sp.]